MLLDPCGPVGQTQGPPLRGLGQEGPQGLPWGLLRRDGLLLGSPTRGLLRPSLWRGWWLVVGVPTARSLCTPWARAGGPTGARLPLGWRLPPGSQHTDWTFSWWAGGRPAGEGGLSSGSGGRRLGQDRGELSATSAGAVTACVTAHLPADLGQVGALRLGTVGLLGPLWRSGAAPCLALCVPSP